MDINCRTRSMDHDKGLITSCMVFLMLGKFGELSMHKKRPTYSPKAVDKSRYLIQSQIVTISMLASLHNTC